MLKFFVLLILVTCSYSNFSQSSATLVLPGDYPDPSVVKIGDSYWATATTSNWAPAFPLMESKDLYHWNIRGHVFRQLPAWADYYFWAPEISYENGKVYVFYSAHKKGGNLCLGVASADKPEGPYTDHGPLMCEPAGSIDAFQVRDEKGKLYLVWKEDGNSVKKPTPIWAAELNETRTAIIGEKKELFHNDASTWEKNVVEGVSMIRRNEYFYAFYAGAGCCGRGCTYAVGIARAKNLLGPWEKYAGNPVQTGNEEWKCPGHGTPVERDGNFYFLYHSYNKEGDVYLGRQGMLQKFKFTDDGWIAFENTTTHTGTLPSELKYDFDGEEVDPEWEWSVFNPARTNVKGGKLSLQATPRNSGSFIALKTKSADYEAEASVIPSAAAAGVALIGDDKNMIRAVVHGNEIIVLKLENDNETILLKEQIATSKLVHLRLNVRHGKDILFSYSIDGTKFLPLNPERIDGHFLPPWDRALRVGLVSKGSEKENAMFEWFILRN